MPLRLRRALPFRGELVKAIGLSAAEFQRLREELVKLRTNLSEGVHTS